MAAPYKPRVSYFYDNEVGNYHYGPGHPMKPHRVRMAHHLIVNYGLYRAMDIFRPRLCDHLELTRFHSDDYVNFLRMVTPDNMHEHLRQLQRFNVGDDCPVFDGLYEYVQITASGSIGGAELINSGDADIAINWSGGAGHHAKKSEASGFCYVNDCVLGALELLKQHQRVLYIDIDIHHGDGVEEAFYTTDRCMCFSLHKYGDYFPGTGDWRDTGTGKGKGYSVNGPLRDGIDDESYAYLYRPLLDEIISRYQPTAIVLQCGADSLSGDRLGCFNLSVHGHGDCVAYTRSKGLPMLVIGGGGYTMRNVARCWTYETSVLCGKDIPDELPYNEYFEYYGPDYKLHITPSNMENLNDRRYLDFLRMKLTEQLRGLEAAPGVQAKTGQDGRDIPRSGGGDKGDPADVMRPDERVKDEDRDRKMHDAELYAGDRDNGGEGGADAKRSRMWDGKGE